jgi:hypothetical protein
VPDFIADSPQTWVWPPEVRERMRGYDTPKPETKPGEAPGEDAKRDREETLWDAYLKGRIGF